MNYQPVTPPARWRWRRIRPVLAAVLLLALWLGGTGWAVNRLVVDHPDPNAVRVAEATVLYTALWGAALRQPWNRRKT